MQLHYLLFDFSDEDSGHGSFDAMATVRPDRLPALLAEVSAVLRWARGMFGPAGAAGEESEWDFDLQAADEAGGPLHVGIDGTGEVSCPPDAAAAATTATVTLTLGGSPSFCEALRLKFQMGD